MRTNRAKLWPIYRSLLGVSELSARLAAAEAALADCHLCGNDCGIDRTAQAGPCGLADTLYVASYGPHHGEEGVLRGHRGSGTIFFSGCNLHCVTCQNHDISQRVTGFAVDAPGLAKVMLALQAQGCHNINLVSPTHIASLLVPALALAAEAGLAIPIVYNTGGYDAPQALALMDGIVDIYLPDMKYADAAIGEALSGVRDYPAINRAALREMYRQVGDLAVDDHGVARRGLLVRHLVLPGGLAGTAEVAGFLVQEISSDTYINVMAQYRPAYRAYECATPAMPLDRRVTRAEVATAVRQARAAGLWRFDGR
jgi:putative pyruvate formate lyase activating enzyme